jgi:hypothetical protein
MSGFEPSPGRHRLTPGELLDAQEELNVQCFEAYDAALAALAARVEMLEALLLLPGTP